MIIEIDPRVDIVFKKLFGSPEHPRLTKSLVNSMLKAADLPLAVELTIRNPFNLAEFEGEKSSEIDILYKDEAQRDVQLEMQICTHAGLPQRMVHNWSQLFNKQLQKGQDYLEHKPVVAIWILDQQLFDGASWLHAFRWRDSIKSNDDAPLSACEAITILHQDACIITIELPVWLRLNQGGENTIVTEAERWNFFLTQSHGEEERRILANLGDPIF